MKIVYNGHSSFTLSDGVSVLFDPFKQIGFDMEHQCAEITLCSHSHYDHHAIDLVDSANIIDFEFNGRICSIAISSIKTFHDETNGTKRGENIVYKVYFNGKTFVHLGDIGFVDPKVIEFAKNCDVLFVPVGGYYTINHVQAKEFIDKIKPQFAIPMHFKTKDCTINISPIDEFLAQFNSYTTHGKTANLCDLKNGVNYFDFDGDKLAFGFLGGLY